MGRRRFEHLVAELSVALGRLAPRYALWLRLHELGHDPGELGRRAAITFFDEHLEAFLAEHSLRLEARARRRLGRAIAHFDARHPSPLETMERLGAGRS